MNADANPASEPTLRHTTAKESWTLLRDAVIGRLAVLVDGAPDIFPVNFAVDSGSIVIRTAGGTKHSAALAGPVAFEVDGYDTASGEAWSVVAKGRAVEVRDMDEVIDALQLPLAPWHDSRKPHFMRIVPDDVSGRRFPVRGGVRSQQP